MFGGMYDTIDATSCHVDCLSVGVFFKTERVDERVATIVSYADCANFLPAYGITLQHNLLVATIFFRSIYIGGVSNTIQFRLTSVRYHRTAPNSSVNLH